MADRSVKVILKAQVDDFTREMGRASKSLDDVAKAAGYTEGASKTSLGRMVQSARLQQSEWETVAKSLAVVGGAWTGMNVLVAKTGIEYNTLQQSSRAALRALLGGAEAANAQMDKLDAFARTSPFSKAVFIQAQQQMLGFGIEAKKVIPYLSAINEAVAATGGSNQDIAELTRIFSQVQAASKITAVDLMQFGQRGVDAAAMIGSQMGKTGAQIREEITAGTLDSKAALDALAAGMQQRFGGASENIKNTMVGALDRVKAAWRDLSASIMEPAVGKEGGGFLVDLTNGLADVLRFVERMPAPMKQAAGLMSGLGGGAALAAGGVAHAIPSFIELYDATKRLREIAPRATSAIVGLGKAAGVAGATFATLAILAVVDQDMRNARVSAAGLADAVERLASASADIRTIDFSVQRMQFSTGGIKIAVDSLGDLYTKMKALEDVGGAKFGRSAAVLRDYAAGFAEIDRSLSELDTADAAAAFDKVAGALLGAGASTEELVALFPKYASVIRGAAETTGEYGLTAQTTFDRMRTGIPVVSELAGGARVSAEELKRLQAEQEAATKAHEKWIDAVISANSAFIDLTGGYDAVIAKNKEVAEAAAAATKSSKDSWQDYYDGVSVGFADYLAELEKQVAAQQQWQTNMVLLAGRVSQGMLDHLAELGPKGATLVADMVNATDDELARMEDIWSQSGAESGRQFVTNLEATQAVLAIVSQRLGKTAVDEISAQLASGKTTLQDVVSKYDLWATVNADTDPAIRAAIAATATINRMTARIAVSTTPIATPGKITISPGMATGGYVGDYVQRFAYGGLPSFTGRIVTGPGTRTSDSVPSLLSRDEFVHNASAVDYYGRSAMYAINAKAVPRELFAMAGYASGGSPRGQVYSAPAQSSMPALVIDSSGIGSAVEAGIRDGMSRVRILLDGREVAVRIGFDDLALRAHAAGRGI